MGLGRRFCLVFSGALLMGVLVQAQPMGKPHVRWIAGGAVFGPNRMAFSDDGGTLFTLSASDYGLRRWDLDERRLTKLIRLPSGRTFGGIFPMIAGW
ncbi:MAG TPA: hypothetical protein VMS21_03645 [Methylomirabilota bacterium]|nr:hypothetical protein [Methylomirabilota bacterium]